jgi:FlaA1/EpsC-like NDP-sugar epimerase
MNRKQAIILHDFIITAFAWQGAWLLRFNLEFPFFNWQLSLYVLPLIILLQGLVYKRFKLYKGLWRFASLPDLWNIFRACVIGALSITIVLFMWNRLEGIPRSILILYPILLMFFLGTPRLTYRMWKDHSLKLSKQTKRKSVLVVGAGAAGDMLVRDMLREGVMLPVALVDDSPKLIGSEIHGVEIVGDTTSIVTICSEREIDIIVIAIPSATNQQIQSIVTKCEKTECAIRILPGIQDTISGKVTVNDLREVMIEDLLGRDKVKLDWSGIRKGLDNKKVLVTGGGGSIGSELCKQIASLSPSLIIVMDHSEYNLYRIEQALEKINVKSNFVLGSICDLASVEKVISENKPDVIYHAAAYKHVPILQRQPFQAIKNNILGTKNLIDIAGKYNCERFVFISTDKAVNPANVLGASKRIAEMYIETQNKKHNTKCMTVRFGNVLDSEGSVVPVFREQIKNGGPVTVTDPDITRYFMTIPEACQLILQASAIGNGGEIFVLDMGEPVKISFLAEQMIRLSGLTLNKDISISYIGLRPGEKMYEELFYGTENKEKTSHEKIFIAKYPDINSSVLCNKIEILINNNENTDFKVLESLIQDIVPYSNSKNNVIPIKDSQSL